MVAQIIQSWKQLSLFAKLGGAVALVALIGFAFWTITPLFYSTRIDEEFPVAAKVVAAPTAMAEPSAMAEVMTEPSAMAEPTAEPTAEPQALAAGSFTRIDRLHSAEGSATIYRLADGKLVLRLENFTAQNGPDLYVGFSGHAIPRRNAELMDNGYLELGRLKASSGNQNYELPAGFDLGQFKSVTIYCRAFSVVFSTAELL